ncbi:MAG: ParB/RepB/Spo0J family partition protein [Candidatus Liptonbacteria bacterium]|nr:ParB/RepB/Spo0J family partition protein [Candidatus Liptonbacteria bacterium]
MLGKGLESLIPPQDKGQVSSVRYQDDQAPNQPQINADNYADERGKEISVNQRSNPRKSAASQQDAIFHIELEKIKSNPQQPRRHFNEEGIRELAASIREFGLLQPIVVTKIEKETATGSDVEYQLIAGERRWLAAKMLGLERIPAIIRNVDLEQERLELAIIENIQRADLSPIERARAFSKLQDEFRLTQREIASKLGKSREVVANTVRLLDLPANIQEALEKGNISESHSRLLLSIEEPAAQERIFRELLENSLTTRDLKNRVRQLKSQPEDGEPLAEKSEISPELKMIQERLSAELGAPVEIERKGERGKITITFYSPEELENIISKFEKEN